MEPRQTPGWVAVAALVAVLLAIGVEAALAILLPLPVMPRG